MPRVNYIDDNNNTIEIDVPVGISVMQGAVNNGIEGIVAECGGAMACCTCHVFVDEEWIEKTGRYKENEGFLLEMTDYKENSRLACQIEMTEELDGLVVRLPESQGI